MDAATAGIDTVRWVKVFTTGGVTGTTTDTFTARADRAGDAILIHAYCGGPGAPPSGASITATGWSFAMLSPVTGSSSQADWAVAFAAIAPNTTAATFTVRFTTASCSAGLASLGDEFTNNNLTGGATTFVEHAEAFGQDDCTVALSPGQSGDAVWGGCSAGVLDVGPGFVKGTDDGGGNWTESRITTASDGGPIPVTFVNQAGHDYIITAATIKHR